MSSFEEKLRAFLHDPIDKCFNIPTHIERAKNYAEKVGICDVEKEKGSDQIASCIERSLLPPNIQQEFNEIRHPLCSSVLQVEDLNKKEIFKKIEKIYTEIGSEISNWNNKNKFFFLWRNLQDKIWEKFKNEEWTKYIPLLPADTRVPDHSIWEHLKITSAVKAYWDVENKSLFQNNSLFLFTLGPVQSFISQARKTQDLYMGSFILSYLTFQAMEIIIDNFGPTNIIYPDLFRQPLMDLWIKKNLFEPLNYNENLVQLPTIPNRFVAILPMTNKEEIIKLASNIKEKIKSLVNTSMYYILDNLNINYQTIKDKIDSQISDFLKIYWVSLPWKIDGKDITLKDLKIFFNFEKDSQKEWIGEELWEFATKYGEHSPNIGVFYELLYSLLERFMGARKNIKEFKQPLIEEKGRKCSVCGERDVIFFRETQNKNKFIKFNKSIIDLTENNKISPKFLADGEGLCAICFLKRTFEIYLEKEVSEVFKDLSFPSTAEVASSDFKEKVLKTIKNKYLDYQRKISEVLREIPTVSPLPKLRTLFENNIDGSWFYEENLTEKYIKDELKISIKEQKIKELKNLLKEITEKVGRPNPYYALLYLDVDYMGRWLSGEFLPSIENAYNSNVWSKIDDDFKQKLLNILPKNRNNNARKLLTPAIHASISTALRNYTLEFVKKIVEEEHLGKLIYSGGDDVLALVNIKDLFDVMQKLRWSFSGEIKIEEGEIKPYLDNKTGFVKKDGRYVLTMGPEATASMGVVIAHYKTPLQEVIKKVFEMKKIAKGDYKKKFSICLMRRSGEERIAKAEWIYKDEDIKETLEILKILGKAFDERNEKGYIAKSFIQKFASEFINLKKDEGQFNASATIFNIELLRLIKRSYNSPKGKKINKEEKQEFLNNIYESMKNLFWITGGNIDNFINFCVITAFIYTGGD
ncbi:MAG: type III-B CRISPR-associated protein Cas10/Cmr2 [Dictyoglomus sp.]|nr:type III-B CRISPR-associated protein Cas10/Cmr2 [Dictyoglomus sp.]MDW8188817.1 type III-B CRISPR-associated protein Cas10/Cmr2 [Dictyoglomus sp.]